MTAFFFPLACMCVCAYYVFKVSLRHLAIGWLIGNELRVTGHSAQAVTACHRLVGRRGWQGIFSRRAHRVRWPRRSACLWARTRVQKVHLTRCSCTVPTNRALDAAQWKAARRWATDYARRLDEGREVAGSYQAVYQKSRRTICSWIEQARYNWIAAGMPGTGPAFPPLDRPEEMHAWWVGNMTNAAPAILLTLATPGAATSGPAQAPRAAASSARADKGTSPAGAASEVDGAREDAAGTAVVPPAGRGAGATAHGPIDTSGLAPMDLESAYQAQSRYVAEACHRYDVTRARREPAATAAELKTLGDERNAAIETLRKMKADLERAQMARGHLVALPEIRKELAPLLTGIAADFLRTLVQEAGFPQDRATALADRCFERLRNTRFGTAAAAPIAPTTAPPLAA